MRVRTVISIFLLFAFILTAVAACAGDASRTDGDMDTAAENEQESDVYYACAAPTAARQFSYLADETFDFGPYLMQPQQTSIAVMWRTLTEEDGTVFYGPGDTPSLSVSQEGVSTIHEIMLTGLTPNTRYCYQVKSGADTSALHHFHTAPDPAQGFSVAIWGDSQDNPHIFSRLVDHMATLQPYFTLAVGDQVSEGGEFDLWKERLFGPARALFHEVGFYMAIGNHERNHKNWYSLMSLPHPQDDPAHEAYYSFTYGNAFFLVIDTDRPYYPIGLLDSKMSTFIKEQVASPEAQAAKWRFAISHYPGYAEAWGDSVCDSYGGEMMIREWLYPLLNEYRFHAHFAGHMHGYERGQSDGLITMITGGGGGGLDSWCVDLPEVSVAQYVHHHLLLEVGCDTAKISAYDLDGVKFDWVELDADRYGQIIDEGPMEGLPDPTINPDSPTLDGDREDDQEGGQEDETE